MARGRESMLVRHAIGWTGAILGLSLVGSIRARAAYAQDPAPASALSDAWQGDKLDPKWNVTVMGDAQDQESAVAVENGKLRIQVGGSDIWGNGDNGIFIWQPANGDFDVILEMHSITRTNDSSKVGIMVRSDLSKYSPNVFLQGMPKGGTMQARLPGVEISGTDSGPGSGCPANCNPWGNNDGDIAAMPVIHQRLSRRGNVFTSARSYDGGKTWGPLHLEAEIAKETIEAELPDDVLVGIAMTGHNVSEVGEAVLGPIAFNQVATRPTDKGLIAATAVDADGNPVADVGVIVQKGDERLGTSLLEDLGLASNTASFFLAPGVYTVRAAETDSYAEGAPESIEIATGKVANVKVKVGAAK